MPEPIAQQVRPQRLALTFDAEHPDGGHCPPGNTERILEVLQALQVPAAFFIQGRWATAYPELARRISELGHRVGNHSFYHARMPLLSDLGLQADVQAAEAAILQVTGCDPRPLFRCPFGEGAQDPRVIRGLHRLCYRHVHWDVDSRDWEEGRTAQGVSDQVLSQLQGRAAPSVVLLHSWPGTTAQALPGLIHRLRSEGWELSSLEQLGRPVPERPAG